MAKGLRRTPAVRRRALWARTGITVGAPLLLAATMTVALTGSPARAVTLAGRVAHAAQPVSCGYGVSLVRPALRQGFNPLTASDAQLRAVDFPPRPSRPALLAVWRKYAERYVAGHVDHGSSCRLQKVPRQVPPPGLTNRRTLSPSLVPADGSAPSSNWAGNVDHNALYTDAEAEWVVPLAPCASRAAIRAPPRRSASRAASGPCGPGPARRPPPAKGLIPAPHRDRVHPERRGHLGLAGRAQPHQLHRGQPPPGLITGIPGKGGQAVHPYQAAGGAGHQADPRRDLNRLRGQRRQRQLSKHRRHHPPRSPSRDITSILTRQWPANTHRHSGNAGQRPRGTQSKRSTSGVLTPRGASSSCQASDPPVNRPLSLQLGDPPAGVHQLRLVAARDTRHLAAADELLTPPGIDHLRADTKIIRDLRHRPSGSDQV